MAGKSAAFENQLLLHVFNNTAIANIGDLAGLPVSVGEGSLYVSLHTADPTDGGAQNNFEAAYTGYARVAVARNGTAWVVTGSTVNPAADIDFGECTAAAGSPITHWGVGKEAGTGATELLYAGAITPNITMAIGVIPRVKATSSITED